MTHKLPGPAHSASVSQNSLQLAKVWLPKQRLPALQTLPVHGSPVLSLPSAWQIRVPMLSRVHFSPAAQPHWVNVTLQGCSLHIPPVPWPPAAPLPPFPLELVLVPPPPFPLELVLVPPPLPELEPVLVLVELVVEPELALLLGSSSSSRALPAAQA